jgi:flagellar hook-associated protein 3 FlgL
MSGSITGASSPSTYGYMSQLIADNAAVKQKLDTLTNQASTGLVGTTYAGLGSGAGVSIDLNPELASLQTWQNNISSATGGMGVTQTAMTQITSIAQNFYSQLNNVSSTNSSEIDTIAASARASLQQVAGLLDSQDGAAYVFGGQDSTNPPVPNPDNILNSNFYTAINSAVSQLGANGAAATAAATLQIAAPTNAADSPFSAWLTQQAVNANYPSATPTSPSNLLPIVQVGQDQTVQVGILANMNASVPSTGSSTTGSYTSDILRALATIGSLSSGQMNSGADVEGLVQDTRTSLGNAITAQSEDQGVLGNTQTALQSTSTELSDTATTLTGQVSAVQDVDMATTLSNLSLVQTQLESSYQLISSMSNLSLVKYLVAGQ